MNARLGMRFEGEPPNLESQFDGEEIEVCKLASLQAVLQLCRLLQGLQVAMYADEVLQYCEILFLEVDWQRDSDTLFDANLLLKSFNLEVKVLVAIRWLAGRPRWVDYLHVGKRWCWMIFNHAAADRDLGCQRGMEVTR
jgi:hypothetical protein